MDLEAGAKKCRRGQVRSQSSGRCRSAKAARKSYRTDTLKKRSGSKIRLNRRIRVSRRRPTAEACSAVQVPAGASRGRVMSTGARCIAKGCTFAKGVCRKRSPKAALMKKRSAMMRRMQISGSRLFD